MSDVRRKVELRAGPMVVLAARLPRIVPFAVVGGLLVAGLLTGGPVGALLLGILAVSLGTLLFLSWPALQPAPRALRTAVLLLLAVRAVTFLG